MFIDFKLSYLVVNDDLPHFIYHKVVGVKSVVNETFLPIFMASENKSQTTHIPKYPWANTTSIRTTFHNLDYAFLFLLTENLN